MSVLVDDTVHPVVLFAWMAKHYGHDWIEWTPSTTRATIKADHGAFPTNRNVAKIAATGALASQDAFWHDWPTFHLVTQVMNNQVADPEGMQEHTIGQMMAAVDDATFLRGTLGELTYTPPFDEVVARYVGAQALAAGAWWLPSPLSFAVPYAAGKMYRCKECGNEAEVTFDDGLCDSCTDRWDTSGLRKWEPDPAIVERGQGRALEYTWKNDPTQVESRWNQVKDAKEPRLDDSQVDTCVARLLLGKAYMDERRRLRDAGLAAL